MAKNNLSKGDNPALSLYQLIGAPLHAIVDAEAQAAMTTRDFIRDVGFEAEAEDGGDYGDLKMVSFQTKQQTPAGQKSLKVQVPLLSMLPIPALQVKDAKLDFFVKIIDTLDHHRSYRPRMPAREPLPAQEEKAPADEVLPELERVDFRAMLSHQPRRTGRTSMEMQMRIKIRVEQADVPAGMARLFNMLEHSVTAEEVPPTNPSED